MGVRDVGGIAADIVVTGVVVDQGEGLEYLVHAFDFGQTVVVQAPVGQRDLQERGEDVRFFGIFSEVGGEECHFAQRVQVHEQQVAESAAASAVVLHIDHQRLDAIFFHSGKHVVKERREWSIGGIHALVELQITDALLREKLIVVERGMGAHDVLSVDGAST